METDLVRVGARFELARVRVIGSRLYKIDLLATQKTRTPIQLKESAVGFNINSVVHNLMARGKEHKPKNNLRLKTNKIICHYYLICFYLKLLLVTDQICSSRCLV